MSNYDETYERFDSALMKQLRKEAYGEDIGQHSWVTANDLRADVRRLSLTSASHVLDLGCGPCGPLTFVLSGVGCRGVGIELDQNALRAGRERASSAGVHDLLTTIASDLNDPLPLESGSFDAVLAFDTLLHVRDRRLVFTEVARVLKPGGRFLFTDASVVSGAISNDEVRERSGYGYTQFVPAGWNEGLLQNAGLRLLESEDRTPSVLRNASGRLSAMETHRDELERVIDQSEFERQTAYLGSVIELSRRRALSRIMYLAEA